VEKKSWFDPVRLDDGIKDGRGALVRDARHRSTRVQGQEILELTNGPDEQNMFAICVDNRLSRFACGPPLYQLF
jgi:hypothetical protein